MINVINIIISLVQDYGLELSVLTKTATDYIDLLDKIRIQAVSESGCLRQA